MMKIQKKIVEEGSSKEAASQYQMPNAIDAVVCILMHFVKSGEWLYENCNPIGCQEETEEGCPLVVEGSNRNGLYISDTGDFERWARFAAGVGMFLDDPRPHDFKIYYSRAALQKF